MNTDFFPKSTAELFDQAIYIYKQAFSKHLAFAAIFGILFAIIGSLLAVGFVFILGIFAFFVVIGTIAPDSYGIFSGVLYALLVFVTIALPMFFAWLSISSAGHILLARQTIYGHKARLIFKEIPKVALRIFGTLVAITILSIPFVILSILTATSGLVAFLLYNFPWIFVGLVLLVIGAYVLFTNIFSLSIAVSVCERRTFFRAISRSWELIKGEFWKIAGMRLLWLLCAMAIWAVGGGLLSLGYNILDGFVGAGFLGHEASVTILGLVMMLVGIFSTVIFFAVIPLDGVFHACLYYNQRIKKEGLDIEIRLGRLPT